MNEDITARQQPGNQDKKINITPQKARQGRMGKQTLIVLVVSMVLAIIAGLALGLIPSVRP